MRTQRTGLSHRLPCRLSGLLLLAVWACPASGQFEAPPDYYASATGSGDALKGQLHDIIDGHTVRSYGDARSILQVTDAAPGDPDSIQLVYDRRLVDLSGLGEAIPGWDSGVSWNREHTWPRSLGVGSSGPDNSDLHLLRPSTPSENSSRGNLSFGGSFGQPFGGVSDGGSRWYPGDDDAGFIARQLFYGAVRYDGSDANTTDLEIAPNGSGSELGDLDRLLEWHFEAAPDDFERRRNQIIFDDYQGNRNPFIDHPELVWSVFVDQQNDSRLILSGGAPSADGGFRQLVDLGRHYLNSAATVSETIRIEKLGSDGTYARVRGEGLAATASANGVYAFRTGGSDSLDLAIESSIDTSSVGLFGGSLFVDNLDVTEQGGAGVGAQDADDVIELQYEVLSHPIASFSPTDLLTEITLDLGFLPLSDAAARVASGRIVNFGGPGAPASAATLDLDSVSGEGDSSQLKLEVSAFQGLEQGRRVAFGVALDVDSPGAYSSRFELLLSGEDLPGEQTQSLFVNITAEIVNGDLPGDFNGDGLVDAADYTVWRDAVGQPAGLFNGLVTGFVDERDYEVWLANFGEAASPQSTAIPEPGSLGTLTGLVAPLCFMRRAPSSMLAESAA